MSNHFSLQNHHGSLTFCQDGKPVFPLMFWQTELLDRDAAAFRHSGVKIFSFFRSLSHYRHPWWVGVNEFDFSRFDQAMHLFKHQAPGAFAIPRVFVSAPEWWLQQNPDELCGFAPGVKRTSYDAPWQGTLHESFASEKWKNEMGEAFRQLIRHFKSSDYADEIIAIHLAGGIFGEWHNYSPLDEPDSGIAMTRRYGKPIPREINRQADYYEKYFSATVEAIDHFARIVKAESDYLVATFYGYTPDMVWSIAGDHRAAAAMHRLTSVDMISAPHSYSRRNLGDDALFRNYPASLALHGKLFIDEGDDRTYLDGVEGNNIEHVKAATPADFDSSLQVIRREFGNMITHNIAMWYMDLNGGNFHDARLMAEITRLKKYGDESMRLSRTRPTEVALISNLKGEFYLPKRETPGNQVSGELYDIQLRELCRSGAIFDWYLAEDLDHELLAKYKVIILLDCVYLNALQREALAKFKSKHRTIIFFYGAGSISPDGTHSLESMRNLTELDLEEVPQVTLTSAYANKPYGSGKIQQPGFVPLESEKTFAEWKSIYCGVPGVPAARLRELFADAGVWIYLDTDDVVSASHSALMLHGVADGLKHVRLPGRYKVIDIINEHIVSEAVNHFTLSLKRGQTALYLLEPLEV